MQIQRMLWSKETALPFLLANSRRVIALALAVLASSATAQFAYQRIWSMGYASDSGSSPYSSLIEGPDCALYGTTYGRGASYSGTIFKINTDGSGYWLCRESGVVESFRWKVLRDDFLRRARRFRHGISPQPGWKRFSNASPLSGD